MSKTPEQHNFHIPVMGIGFTIDTPIKVAHLGISSVISLVDDILIEKMRKFYCEKLDIPFQEISDKVEDFRAKRITEYLNLLDKVAKEKLQALRGSIQDMGDEIKKYVSMLPESSTLKKKFDQLGSGGIDLQKLKYWILDSLHLGSIDVNIMTKLDKENFKKNLKLPVEFNDAHAALRGFANSNVESSVIFSAGMNPRLYSYIEGFDDFYPDDSGNFKKKITLKVSDFRSAFIQGKMLAKKGMWVSEYRIESGLNCGGHAFATEGHLIGPILEEFKSRRSELIDATYQVFRAALEAKNRSCPESAPEIRISAQGGVGTAEEHQFLLDHYEVDSVGWGSPFLLVPEVVNVDKETQDKLSEAEEKEIYLSNISPLGVPFNTLIGNTKDLERLNFIDKGRPGSACSKKYASLSKEFTEEAICTASRQYQNLKIKELNTLEIDSKDYKKEFDKIVEKSCICVGLGTSALIKNNLNTKFEGPGVSVCPGPNIAYFSESQSLRSMVDHIYGRKNVIKRSDRPMMFIKELQLYVDYFMNMADESQITMTEKKAKYLMSFQHNLNEGISYYRDLFSDMKEKMADFKTEVCEQLESLEKDLSGVRLQPVIS